MLFTSGLEHSLIKDEFGMEMLVHFQSLEQKDVNLIDSPLLQNLIKLYPGGLWSKYSRQEYCPLLSSY